MRIFVLTTGRSGSTTFARACGHMTNFTAAHESRARLVGPARLKYPDDHIEVDNRLTWFLGLLHERYPDARYVHLTRDVEETAASFADRWTHDIPPPGKGVLGRVRHRLASRHPGQSLVMAFAYSIVMRPTPWPPERRLSVARFLVRSMDANIREYLRDKPHVTVRLESATTDFADFWEWSGAQGDKAAALAEWDVRHNARA